MRVIAGTARGRRLKEPAGFEIRPTTDQVKEAMFNICQFDIEGRRVLDLFGGTGQLGIEAKSRGAAAVDIVDCSRDSLRLIRENVQSAGVAVSVHRADALEFLRAHGPWDLILLDPPYAGPLAAEAIKIINLFDKLSIGGIIICETDAKTDLPEPEPPYVRHREYRYGKVRLTTFIKEKGTETL